MDGGDIYKAANSIRLGSLRATSGRASSLRSGSTSVWRNSGMDVFSKSSREDDDEEALKWASLEKLPTFDRLKKGLLFGSTGPSNQVDVDNLGTDDRRHLLDRLVKVADEDNEKFENVTVEADVNTGSRALPSFINFHIDVFEGILNLFHLLPNSKRHITILDDVSGIVKPKRMTLLLGPPSSGKTTLLLALAGTLAKELTCSGKVTYNGHELHEFVPERTSAYISQNDVHIGEMTVRETLAFSARCQGVGSRYGEMIVGPSKVLLMDEISTGLDSSTTFQIVNSLKQFLHILEGTAVISLLQPAPETYDLFDDIILLTDGKIVTSKKDQQQYWMKRDEPYRFVTAKEFAEAYQSFHVGRKLGDNLSTPYDKSKSHPAALTHEKYGLNSKELLKACTDREILLMKRNSFMHKDDLEDGGLYTGALFFGVVMIMFNGMSEISMTIAKLPVFYKQRDFLFYPSWAYALPSWVIKIPVSFLEAGVWTILTYYTMGFDPNVSRFFKHYLILLLVNQMSSGLFRFIGALGRNMIVANTFGSFAILVPLNGTTLGTWAITGRGFFAEAYWYWIAVAALLGFIFFFNLIFALSLAFLNPFGKAQANASAEDEGNAGAVELSSTKKESKDEGKQGVGEDRLLLLKGVSGAFRPGVLTALMGVSGAGKTTLMDVLAGRKTGGYIDGDVKISGYPKKQETFARISGYCEQNDIHSPHVTVYESLLYSAWLRLASDVDENKRKMFVDEVMDLVELNPLKDALVGLPGVNGLSTEQRKRLTIAVELVANPSIIFMDEPTSGLDARAAAIVMRTVRNTVDTGRTVVCTIHQPSIDIFEAFDELFLMKRGGQELYVGPIGRHSCELIKYFESKNPNFLVNQDIEGVSKIKDGYNPATWMLEVSTSAQEMSLGVDFTEIYRNSERYKRNKALIAELSVPRSGTQDLHYPTQYSQPFLVQCKACLWKQRWSYWRNPPYTAVRFVFTTAIALMFGTLFWDLGGKRDSQQDLINAIGSMYAAVIFLGVQNASSVQPVVDVERTVLVEIPYVCVQTGVYSIIVYSMIGFEWTAAKFF
ncbi:hypothetical protein Ccrd_015657 [Cynara cardunculus var. scolymus]|uniref:ABC transporter domain-containing protein n=1 Tax=Cynara cardunculus var. scolymus TaxID=59895 RepID=A0A103YBD5_CYNCS|nr:hypothetical protein Ccrd_015657 [Cynara cardunculus var. scolymus]